MSPMSPLSPLAHHPGHTRPDHPTQPDSTRLNAICHSVGASVGTEYVSNQSEQADIADLADLVHFGALVVYNYTEHKAA